MIALLRQVAEPGDAEGARWAGMRIHLVSNETMAELGYSSKLNAEWEFLHAARRGAACCGGFPGGACGDLGKRSSLDLDLLLEGI